LCSKCNGLYYATVIHLIDLRGTGCSKPWRLTETRTLHVANAMRRWRQESSRSAAASTSHPHASSAARAAALSKPNDSNWLIISSCANALAATDVSFRREMHARQNLANKRCARCIGTRDFMIGLSYLSRRVWRRSLSATLTTSSLLLHRSDELDNVGFVVCRQAVSS